MDMIADKIAFIGACGYLAASFENLEANQMGEVMIFGNHFCTVGPGPKIVPKGIFRLERFPTRQFNLKLKVPITPAQAETAMFYRDGVAVRWKDLDAAERDTLLSDPLNHRFEIVVEAPLMFEFVRSELYQFIQRIGTREELERQLGEVAKNTLEGIFGHVTVATALDNKVALSLLYSEKINQIVAGGDSDPLWGIRIVKAYIGPVELTPEVARHNNAAAAALAERKQIIVLSEARKKEFALLGEGRAQAVQSMADVMESPSGKEAAVLDAFREAFRNTEKMVVAPGLSGPIAGIKEMLDGISK